jgi:hypothetical protein
MKKLKKGDRIVLGEGYPWFGQDEVTLYDKDSVCNVEAKGVRLMTGGLDCHSKIRLVVEVLK